VTRWGTDENFLGTYSFITPEAEISKAYPDVLSEPASGGRLLFAGEATSQDHFSTMHGAVESGRREAYRILQKLKCDTSPS